MSLTSISQIDLSPIPGKSYFTCSREWREEFIYFLLVDRFHDGTNRNSVKKSARSPGIQTPNDFYGGNIKGITNNLDYIAGLGCTAIWLSPVFENNSGAYHGYNINNYLDIDSNFGTKADLIDLVDKAHARNPPMRIILDVVVNHSGDNWSYQGDQRYHYSNGQQFPFGSWRKPDRPIPVELRKEELYHRRGEIGNWDTYPEKQHGDILSLKDFANDDDASGSELINILIKVHCYWIREADIDGFRVDAVKHMGELACSKFCSNVREYANSLGKRGFFLFGEIARSGKSDEEEEKIVDGYIGQNTSMQDGNNTVFFGLNSVLDFRLASSLPSVIKSFTEPGTLFARLEAQRTRALNRGELGRYLVTFVDNHDRFWQPAGRIANSAPDEQVIAAIGYILCALGTPCLYYGTEQGFEGHGEDNNIREAMFDQAQPEVDLLNPDCFIYREIAKIAMIVRKNEALRFGRMYFRQISGDGQHFGLPYGNSYTLAFSRLLYPKETLIAYNVSQQSRNDYIIVDAAYHKLGGKMTFLYGKSGQVEIKQASSGALYVQVGLAPMQFCILE